MNRPNRPAPDKLSDTLNFLRKYVFPSVKLYNPLTGREELLDEKSHWDIKIGYAYLLYATKLN